MSPTTSQPESPFQVLDFGPGNEDTGPIEVFEGTERECNRWMDERNTLKPNERYRYGLFDPEALR